MKKVKRITNRNKNRNINEFEKSIRVAKPESCVGCLLLDMDSDYPRCRITNETRGYNFDINKKRMDECPFNLKE